MFKKFANKNFPGIFSRSVAVASSTLDFLVFVTVEKNSFMHIFRQNWQKYFKRKKYTNGLLEAPKIE